MDPSINERQMKEALTEFWIKMNTAFDEFETELITKAKQSNIKETKKLKVLSKKLATSLAGVEKMQKKVDSQHPTTPQRLPSGQIFTSQPGHSQPQTVVRQAIPSPVNMARPQVQFHMPVTMPQNIPDEYNETAAEQHQQMMENVKKCKSILSTLIKLAACESEATSSGVRNLIQGLIDGKLEPEVFTKELQKQIKSDPLDDLVPYLKKGLPLLRQSLLSNKMTIEGLRPPPLEVVQQEVPTTVPQRSEAMRVNNQVPVPAGPTMPHITVKNKFSTPPLPASNKRSRSSSTSSESSISPNSRSDSLVEPIDTINEKEVQQNIEKNREERRKEEERKKEERRKAEKKKEAERRKEEERKKEEIKKKKKRKEEKKKRAERRKEEERKKEEKKKEQKKEETRTEEERRKEDERKKERRK